MRLAYLHFADAANFSTDGKLNIFGVFTSLGMESIPVLFPSLVIVFGVDGSPEDFGVPHDFFLEIRHEASGTVVFGGHQSLPPVHDMPPATVTDPRVVHTSIVQVTGLAIIEPGRYRADVLSGGVKIGSSAFLVRALRLPAPTPTLPDEVGADDA